MVKRVEGLRGEGRRWKYKRLDRKASRGGEVVVCAISGEWRGGEGEEEGYARAAHTCCIQEWAEQALQGAWGAQVNLFEWLSVEGREGGEGEVR